MVGDNISLRIQQTEKESGGEKMSRMKERG
jgi:hypothetical protein